jgi:hypothetical protein
MVMQITLTLDDDVRARLQAESRRSGKPFSAVVNECLRAGLAGIQTTQSAPPFVVAPVHLGTPLPGLPYDRISCLLEEAEGAHR